MSKRLVVIGTGPGGYIAAIRAAQLGFDVTAIEKDDRLGGTCLNVGCIPSKSMLNDTYFYKKGVPGDLAQMLTKKEDVVKGLTDGVAGLFKKNGIKTVRGEASFISDKKIKVGGQELEADYVIIATGSAPSQIPFLPFDEKRVVSSTGALEFTEVPKRLVVVGGGVIGVELASVWSRLGSQVTVIEMLPEIIATLDPTVCRTMLSILKKQGIEFLLNTKLEHADLSGDDIELFYEGGSRKADKVLVATGRRPYTDKLNVEAAGVALTNKGFIPVNGAFQTANPSLYAIGDVIEGPMLAHKAMEEGVAAVEGIAGLRPHIRYMAIPNVVYTHPEAASVGLTEPEAKQLGRELLIGSCSMKAIGRARCNGDTDGLVKIIGDKKSGRLLGMHIVAETASEMIGEGVVALNKYMTVEELANASHAHPTLSECIKEGALAALGRPLSF